MSRDLDTLANRAILAICALDTEKNMLIVCPHTIFTHSLAEFVSICVCYERIYNVSLK